jgi:hypothetical protein
VTLTGRCHCGALTVELTTALAPEKLTLRECGCSFCRLHGARTTTDRGGQLRIVAERDQLGRYRFAQRTADFLICRRCGVYVGCVIDDAFGSLNTRVLDEAARLTQPAQPVDYDGETAAARRARRLGHWTPATVELRP